MRPAHLLWTAMLLCLAYGAGSLFSWGSPTTSRFMGDFGLAGAASASAISCLLRGRIERGRLRAAWSLLGGSAVMVALGNGVWGWYEVVLRTEIPTPSLADVVFLFFAPLAIAGLLLFAGDPRGGAGWIRLGLDAWLIAGSLFTLGWSLALARTAEGAAGDPVRAVLALAYPLFDIVLISLVLAVRFRAAGGERAALNVALAALAITVVCDGLWTAPSLRGDYHSGELLDTGWFTGSMLLACAPWMGARPWGRSPARAAGRIGAALSELVPYLAAAACMLDVIIDSLTGHRTDSVVITTAVSVLVALVARQGATLLDNTRLTRELAAREVHFRSLVQRSSDVITITDATGTLQYASPAMRRVFGFVPELLSGTRATLLVHPGDVRSARKAVADFIRAGAESGRIECRIRTAEGQWRHTESTVSRHAGGLIFNSRDVTERVALREQLAHYAFHDPLTGLANRALFTRLLADELSGAGGHDGRIAVLFLDLDGFKAVNDTAGHAAGDELLAAVAGRLNEVVRDADTVARFGGDEFAVMIRTGGGPGPAREVAERFLDRLGAPFRIAGVEVMVGASVGVAFSAAPMTADDLMRNADHAMYRAKAAGKGRVEVYTGVRDGEAPGALRKGRGSPAAEGRGHGAGSIHMARPRRSQLDSVPFREGISPP